MLDSSRWRSRVIATVSALALSIGAVAATPIAAHAVDDPSVSITSSSTTSVASPTITGTFDSAGMAEGTLTLYVSVDGDDVCQIPFAVTQGTFQCEIGPLAEGESEIEVRLWDNERNTYIANADQTLTYAPPRPTIVITSSESTSTSLPTISGTFDRGSRTAGQAEVHVILASATVCKQSVSVASGTFSCTVSSPLSAGQTPLVIVRLQIVGDAGVEVIAQTTQVMSYTPPATSVTITSSAAASSATPTLTGTYEWGAWGSTNLGARLVVRDQSYGRDVCTIPAASLSGGTWSCTPDPAFDSGQTPIIVYLYQNGMQSSARVSATQTITVILTPTPTPTPTPSPTPSTPSVTITSPTQTTSARPTITGTIVKGSYATLPNATLEVVIGDLGLACSWRLTHADLATNTFQCTPPTDLPPGTYPVLVTMRSDVSQMSAPRVTAEQSLTVTAGATITGHVFNDANGNGVQDADEPDVSNVTVELWKLTDTGTYVFVASTITRSPYVFTGVAPGTYQVRVPAGTKIAGFAALTSAKVWTVVVSGTGTFTAPAASFGLSPTSSLAATGADVGGTATTAVRIVLMGLLLVLGAALLRRREVGMA